MSLKELSYFVEVLFSFNELKLMPIFANYKSSHKIVVLVQVDSLPENRDFHPYSIGLPRDLLRALMIA